MRTIKAFLITLALIPGSSIAQGPEPENITCKQAFDLIQKFRDDTTFVILDLRTQDMFNEEHIEGAIVYDVFSAGFEDWIDNFDKGKTYLLYCTRGHRSSIALSRMRQTGFKNLYHLNEGIREWNKQGFGTVKKQTDYQAIPAEKRESVFYSGRMI